MERLQKTEMRKVYVELAEGVLDAFLCTVLVHVMLKLVLREEKFYSSEVMMLYLYSWQASGTGCQHSLSEQE